ncbi:Peptidyl-tRNA hydrolase YaeJ [Thiorhodovibrio winogradskyi]|uniref:Peptidyl-tRNA hydrolase YaeJ n=2 Tax=Thiorhodovibrio winogradskyi TaxID=77007 RepID=A0ABZ0SD15_9GAMM
MDQDGVLMIEVHRFRMRERNRAEARERLAELIRQATHRPKPCIATSPSRAAKERRLTAKKFRGRLKQGRSRQPADD